MDTQTQTPKHKQIHTHMYIHTQILVHIQINMSDKKKELIVMKRGQKKLNWWIQQNKWYNHDGINHIVKYNSCAG